MKLYRIITHHKAKKLYVYKKNISYASGDYVPVPEFMAIILALKSLHDKTIIQVETV